MEVRVCDMFVIPELEKWRQGHLEQELKASLRDIVR